MKDGYLSFEWNGFHQRRLSEQEGKVWKFIETNRCQNGLLGHLATVNNSDGTVGPENMTHTAAPQTLNTLGIRLLEKPEGWMKGMVPPDAPFIIIIIIDRCINRSYPICCL